MLRSFRKFGPAFILAVVGFPLLAQASQSPDQVLSASAARDLAMHAHNYEDHLRLATYYSSRADKARINLAEESGLMAHWANVEGMACRTKLPNPYSIAKTMADIYRAELARDTQLAEDQRDAADSVQGHVANSE